MADENKGDDNNSGKNTFEFRIEMCEPSVSIYPLQIAYEAPQSIREIDLLVKGWLVDGDEKWGPIYLFIEDVSKESEISKVLGKDNPLNIEPIYVTSSKSRSFYESLPTYPPNKFKSNDFIKNILLKCARAEGQNDSSSYGLHVASAREPCPGITASMHLFITNLNGKLFNKILESIRKVERDTSIDGEIAKCVQRLVKLAGSDSLGILDSWQERFCLMVVPQLYTRIGDGKDRDLESINKIIISIRKILMKKGKRIERLVLVASNRTLKRVNELRDSIIYEKIFNENEVDVLNIEDDNNSIINIINKCNEMKVIVLPLYDFNKNLLNKLINLILSNGLSGKLVIVPKSYITVKKSEKIIDKNKIQMISQPIKFERAIEKAIGCENDLKYHVFIVDFSDLPRELREVSQR